MRRVLASAVILLSVAAASAASAQPTPDRAVAMAKLSFMRGVWAGPGKGVDRAGPYEVWQTERMGPMLDGDVIVVEGRGYRADGSTGFNAFGVVSWDARTGKYELRSYAQGFAGTFELKPADDGYVWEVPAGPGAVIRYTAVIRDGTWHEWGERIVPNAPPVKVFDMTLKRVADSDWPLGSPVPASTGR